MKEALRSLIIRESAGCLGREGSRLSQARADLKRRYLGHGYGSDAERGQRGLSTYVDRTVLETVEWAKPGLMRLFGGGEEIIRFDPRSPEQEQSAEAATAYVNQAAFGRSMFRLVHDVLTDGLFQRVGWCLAHSVRREQRVMTRFSDLTEAEAMALALEVEQEAGQDGGAQKGAVTSQGLERNSTFNKSVEPGVAAEGQHLVPVVEPLHKADAGFVPVADLLHKQGNDVVPGESGVHRGEGVAALASFAGADEPMTSTFSATSPAAGDVAAPHLDENGLVPSAESLHKRSGQGLSIRFTRRETPAGPRFDAVVHRTVTRRELRLDPVPSEQVILSADAPDVERARFVAHWQIKTASDLRREGWGEALIDSLPAHSEGRAMPETEAGLRVNDEGGLRGRDFGGKRGPASAMREFKIFEGWFEFDIDGDGLAEKVKATWCGDGEACVVMGWEEWPLYRAPLFAACSVPLPHQAVGLCVADLVSDVQDLRSEVTRQFLDNLALANQGELVVNEGRLGGGVEYDSLLARGVGAVHRIRGDASITPLPVAVSTTDALNGLEMSAGIVERRTGITSRTQSLEAQRLQATATGASIMEEAVNQRLELVARVYAETFFKPLGRYLLHLLARWPEPLTLRLKGRYVTLEPGSFDPDMDISVAVGLGTGNRSRLVNTYAQVLDLQYRFLQQLGDSSPVRLADIVYTCHKLAEAAGLEAPERFFGTEEQARRAEQAFFSPKAGPAFPSLAERRFRLEEEETRAKLALEAEKVKLKRLEALK